ncbi:hypothetical protein, partial [Clostridium perfringens]|uniref:hypothetical protein n=1 Tax=Clostridium perfringens TaxID=1502 RepID=UPI002ACBE513
HLAGLFAMQKFIQTYIIFKERVILRIVKLFFHNNLTDSNDLNVLFLTFSKYNLYFLFLDEKFLNFHYNL